MGSRQNRTSSLAGLPTLSSPTMALRPLRTRARWKLARGMRVNPISRSKGRAEKKNSHKPEDDAQEGVATAQGGLPFTARRTNPVRSVTSHLVSWVRTAAGRRRRVFGAQLGLDARPC